jgi:hypothetical protein
MKTLLLIPFVLLSASVCAAESDQNVGKNEPIRLTNGSYLFISQDDTMRMVNNEGKPVQMGDGVEMQLLNGDLFMMKN